MKKKGFYNNNFKMNYCFSLCFSSKCTHFGIYLSEKPKCSLGLKRVSVAPFGATKKIDIKANTFSFICAAHPVLPSYMKGEGKERNVSLLAWKGKVFFLGLTKEMRVYQNVLGENIVTYRDSHKIKSRATSLIRSAEPVSSESLAATSSSGQFFWTGSTLWVGPEQKYSLFLNGRLLKPTLRGTKQPTLALPLKVEAQYMAESYQKKAIPQNGGQNRPFPKGDGEAYPFRKAIFFNQCFDKGRLKNFVLWFLLNYGENKTVSLVEQLKNIGFQYASKAGISLGIDDLKIPPKKADLIYEAEKQISETVNQYVRGEITGVERFQRLIDTWHRTSEVLKQEVIHYFEATDVLNPVYMMAFSGARGNISQVRQLVGMRGLMADPQGQIIDFPIRSNFREGLTLTEYLISSYGARKGIVDTALRTANAGYLTRRLVDVAQHVIISKFDCGTRRGIFLTNMKEGNKTIHSLAQRTVGRILARDLFLESKSPAAAPSSTSLSPAGLWQTQKVTQKVTQTGVSGADGHQLIVGSPPLGIKSSSVFTLSKNKRHSLTISPFSLPKEPGLRLSSLTPGGVRSASPLRGGSLSLLPQREGSLRGKFPVGKRNEEITLDLSFEIGKSHKMQTSGKIFVRSPLTCETSKLICQLCYGWSLGQGNLVSIGEAVGVVAAQSIGEPGTQLTMRTFHTGGVFSGDVSDQIKAPFDGILEYLSAIPGTLIRTPEGQIAFLTKSEGAFIIKKETESLPVGSLQGLSAAGEELPISLGEIGQAAHSSPSSASSPSYLGIGQKNEEKRKYKIPTYTLLYVRNGQNVFEKQVVAQISSISRKSHATDDAQLTIYSQMEGQFYSKSLGFIATHDQFLSPRIPPSTKELFSEPFVARKLSGEATRSGKIGKNSSFNELEVEKIYEAWMWGYAWILSGKVFNFKYASPFFVQLGDFLNNKSYINQITWKLNLNNGNHMYYESLPSGIQDGNFSSSRLPTYVAPLGLAGDKQVISKGIGNKINSAASWASSFFIGKKTSQQLLTFSSKKRQLTIASGLEEPDTKSTVFENVPNFILQKTEKSVWNLSFPFDFLSKTKGQKNRPLLPSSHWEIDNKLPSIRGSLTETALPVLEDSLPYDLRLFLRTGKAIISKQIHKEPRTLKKLYFNQSSNVFFFDLNQIIYKKSAYGLELTNKIGFLSYLPKQRIASQNNISVDQNPEGVRKGCERLTDTLSLRGLYPKGSQGHLYSKDNRLDEQSSSVKRVQQSDFIILLNSLSGSSENKEDHPGTYASFPEGTTLLPSPKGLSGHKRSNFLKGTSQRLGHKYSDFLQWFPSQYQTLTGGVAFFENKFNYDIPRRSISDFISSHNQDSQLPKGLLLSFPEGRAASLSPTGDFEIGSAESAQLGDPAIQVGYFDSIPGKDKFDLFLKKQLKSKTRIDSQRILWLQSNFWKIGGLTQSIDSIAGPKGQAYNERPAVNFRQLVCKDQPEVPVVPKIGSFTEGPSLSFSKNRESSGDSAPVVLLLDNNKSPTEKLSAQTGLVSQPLSSLFERDQKGYESPVLSFGSTRPEDRTGSILKIEPAGASLDTNLKPGGSLLVFAFLNKNDAISKFTQIEAAAYVAPSGRLRSPNPKGVRKGLLISDGTTPCSVGDKEILIKNLKQMNRQGEVSTNFKFISALSTSREPTTFLSKGKGSHCFFSSQRGRDNNFKSKGSQINNKFDPFGTKQQSINPMREGTFIKMKLSLANILPEFVHTNHSTTQPLSTQRLPLSSVSDVTPLGKEDNYEGRLDGAYNLGSKVSMIGAFGIMAPFFDPFIMDLCFYLCKSPLLRLKESLLMQPGRLLSRREETRSSESLLALSSPVGKGRSGRDSLAHVKCPKITTYCKLKETSFSLSTSPKNPSPLVVSPWASPGEESAIENPSLFPAGPVRTNPFLQDRRLAEANTNKEGRDSPVPGEERKSGQSKERKLCGELPPQKSFFIAKSSNFIEKFFNKLNLVKNLKTFEEFMNSRCLRFGAFGNISFVNCRSDRKSLFYPRGSGGNYIKRNWSKEPVITTIGLPESQRIAERPGTFGKENTRALREITFPVRLWMQAKQEVRKASASSVRSRYSTIKQSATISDPKGWSCSESKASYYQSGVAGSCTDQAAHQYKSIGGFIVNSLHNSYGLSKKGWVIIPRRLSFSSKKSISDPLAPKLGNCLGSKATYNFYNYDKKLIYPGQKGPSLFSETTPEERVRRYSGQQVRKNQAEKLSNPFGVHDERSSSVSAATGLEDKTGSIRRIGPETRSPSDPSQREGIGVPLAETKPSSDFDIFNQISFHTPVFTECILLTDIFHIENIENIQQITSSEQPFGQKQASYLEKSRTASSSLGVNGTEFTVQSELKWVKNQKNRYGEQLIYDSHPFGKKANPLSWRGIGKAALPPLWDGTSGPQELDSLPSEPLNEVLPAVDALTDELRSSFPEGSTVAPSQRYELRFPEGEESSSSQFLQSETTLSLGEAAPILEKASDSARFIIGLFIQPIEEYTPNTNNNFKKYVYEYTKNVLKVFKKPMIIGQSGISVCENQLYIASRKALPLPEGLDMPSTHTLPIVSILVNQSFDSLFNWKLFRNSLYNKQENIFLSKYMQQDFDVFSLHFAQKGDNSQAEQFASVTALSPIISLGDNRFFQGQGKGLVLPDRSNKSFVVPTVLNALGYIVSRKALNLSSFLISWKTNWGKSLTFKNMSYQMASVPMSKLDNSLYASFSTKMSFILSFYLFKSSYKLASPPSENCFPLAEASLPLERQPLSSLFERNHNGYYADRSPSDPFGKATQSALRKISSRREDSVFLPKGTDRALFARESLGITSSQREGVANLSLGGGKEQTSVNRDLLLSFKSTFYYHITSLINRTMESPCFSFNLIYPLNMVGLFHNHFVGQVFFPFGQKADILDRGTQPSLFERDQNKIKESLAFGRKKEPMSLFPMVSLSLPKGPDNPPGKALLIPLKEKGSGLTKLEPIPKRGLFTSNSESLLTKTSFQKGGKLPQKTKYLYSFTNNLKSTRYFAETNYYSPFVGEIIYLSNQRNISCESLPFPKGQQDNPSAKSKSFISEKDEKAGKKAFSFNPNSVSQSSKQSRIADQEKEGLPITTFGYNCMFLTQSDLVSYYFTKEESLFKERTSKGSKSEGSKKLTDETFLTKHNYEISNTWTTSINFLKIKNNEFVLELFQQSNPSFFRATKSPSKSLNKKIESSTSLSQTPKSDTSQKDGKLNNTVFDFDKFLMNQKSASTESFVEQSSTKPETWSLTKPPKQLSNEGQLLPLPKSSTQTALSSEESLNKRELMLGTEALEFPIKEVFLNLKISKLKAGVPSIFCGFSLSTPFPKVSEGLLISGQTKQPQSAFSPARRKPSISKKENFLASRKPVSRGEPFASESPAFNSRPKGWATSNCSVQAYPETIINRGKVSSLLGDFVVYGDQIAFTTRVGGLLEKPNPYTARPPIGRVERLAAEGNSSASYSLPFGRAAYAGNDLRSVKTSGQIIHYNSDKITLRRGQAIFISPKGILHKFDGDFIDAKNPVITLSYERLKTGDIIQGIPKVEQFFEARTTKRGRIFRDSLPALLKGLFNRYKLKYPLELAVRQSFYKIQQIIVDGVQRVYKAQGVTIADKHLEVIVKQMTSKVRILDGAQTGFFPGEVVDLFFVEKVNGFLIKKITYEPLVLGITKASLEVDSFLSASSFQQTTRVLSQAAIYRKKDFLKGLKENVILGNLIPAGTGYLVYLNDVSPLN